MKKSDIVTIVLIASMSVLVAFFATNAIFNNIASEEVTVKTIDKIEPDVVQPDERIFRKDSINPTVEVRIDSGNE